MGRMSVVPVAQSRSDKAQIDDASPTPARRSCVWQSTRALLLAAISASPALFASPLSAPQLSASSLEPEFSTLVIEACDGPGFATTLHAATASAVPARAYWLDRRLVKWPGAGVRSDGHRPGVSVASAVAHRPGRDTAAAAGAEAAAARFRLYHSSHGRIETVHGERVVGADGSLPLDLAIDPLPPALAERFRFVGSGPVLAVHADDEARMPDLHRGQLLLVREDAGGIVIDATSLQAPGALDDLYAAAGDLGDLGAHPGTDGTTFRLWAPTARQVALCLHPDDDAPAASLVSMEYDAATGSWSARLPGNLSGQAYRYLVDVHVPGTGVVRNRVTDPYSVTLTADSARSVIADLDDPALKPPGWDAAPRPAPLDAQTDMVIYELHVRDFSRDDPDVASVHRGKYMAFTDPASAGMRHLRMLADAGLTDVHLLPVFDLATVPETGCTEPVVPDAPPDSEAQQAAVVAGAARDCFNWGYDPFHFNAAEGSYASDASDGFVRVRELRAMVQALHAAGLRVGMDVVYNHTTASGQAERSVLDRIVPGYYHRLDADGVVERSTCCDNTATEHMMMARLMIDSAELWVRHYRIDSFRFDLMGHQPRAAMEQLQARVDAAAGRRVELIGEGWNFGEVADGARFVQASQLSLGGSGIGTFSDRARDAIRGGGPADHGDALSIQGWVNGLHHAPDVVTGAAAAALEATDEVEVEAGSRDALMHTADLVRTGLAGTLRDYRMVDRTGATIPLSQLDYKGQPAGYASQPGEVVNYVENHDNQTLFDINALKLPSTTSTHDRARVQVLALALNAFSQGVAYFHAGGELLRSKSLDRNSFDSGDWFNRLDWSGADTGFGRGLPPAADNAEDWPLMRPLLADTSLRPGPDDVAFTRDAFRDLLRIRASSALFRLRSAADVQARLRFHNVGPAQVATVIAGHLDGTGYPGARFAEVLYLVNVAPDAQMLEIPGLAGRPFVLHPVHLVADAGDPRPRQAARYDAGSGRFTVPARTALVYVIE